MSLRVAPIGVRDARALGQLACRADVLRFGDHAPDPSPATWIRWLGPADPNLGLTLGAFVDDQLEAALKIAPSFTRRRLHRASVHVIASTEPQGDAPLDALLRATLDTCDRWLQLARIELCCPADHPRIAGLFAEHGFTHEARLHRSLRVSHGKQLLDEVVLARLRSLQPPPAIRPAAPIPPRGAPAVGAVRIRAAQPSDAALLTATMSEPLVVWGTLQLPFQRVERWSERLESRPPARTTFLVAELDRALVGAGALTVSEAPRRTHSATLGMHVATASQGRGIGGALMHALLRDAERRGLSRVDLTVFPDNERAIRLYQRAGFVVEGQSRWASFRDGTYADDLLMARVNDGPRE